MMSFRVTAPARLRVLLSFFASLLLLPSLSFAASEASATDPPHELMHHSELPEDTALPEPEDHAACIDGDAEGFPCLNVDLQGNFTNAELGGTFGNDIWGWTDPMSGNEYAIMGMSHGTVFVDVTDPDDAVILGTLATETSNSTWRDIKVHNNHAYIVSEAGGHGMQIFHLHTLPTVVSPPVVFSTSGHYDEFGSAHNIVIDEVSGFGFAVGTTTCNGGLHMMDLADPHEPVNVGCFSADAYTHDAQCVTYQGPDVEHQGKEICFNSNEDTLTIVDVTNKATPVQLSRTGYAGSAYTHQGWLTEDHAYHLVNDEVDEISFGHNTKTYIFDVSDLDAPTVDFFASDVEATDHNLYVKGNFAYLANYRSGLRILDVSDVANGNLAEVAFFDVVPGSNASGTSGAWSVYPFFDSGTVVVSSTTGGLFILSPNLCNDPLQPTALSATAAGDGQIDLSWTAGEPGGTFNVYRSFGTCPGDDFELVASDLVGTSYSDSVSGQVDYAYTVSQSDDTGGCESVVSSCDDAATTGACTAPPSFAGVESISNLGDSSCALQLDWSAGSENCGGALTYSVYRSTTMGFEPAPENQVASGLAFTAFTDSTVVRSETYYYIVRATDLGSGTEDGNSVVLSGTPTGPTADGTWAAGAELGDSSVLYGTGAGFTQPDLKHIGWEPSSARAHSGDRSYFSTYANGQCTFVMTPPISLSAGQSSQLSFWTAYEIEGGFDGGVVQISDDGGDTWSLVTPDQGYPGSFISSTDACGFLNGDPAFTGVDLTFDEFTADLSAFNGGDIQIRWIFSTDGGLTLEGWYLDDIEITHAEVPDSCFGGLFGDGFESASTGSWSNAIP